MDLTFRTKKLERLANDYRRCQRELGAIRSKLLNIRLNDLKVAETLEDVRQLPGRYHELTGDRKGQWACDLDHPYRLIFEPHENPIPVTPDGNYLWIEIKGVKIVEIIDYHNE